MVVILHIVTFMYSQAFDAKSNDYLLGELRVIDIYLPAL